MRFLIIRSGSGWGGIISRYIIDTKESIKIDLDKHFIITGEDIFDLKGLYERLKIYVEADDVTAIKFIDDNLYLDILSRPTSSFNKNSRSYIDLSGFDIEWFEENMKVCKISTGGTVVFDIQSDCVYALLNGECVQVLSSYYPQIWINDCKLRDMMNRITGIVPMYELFVT